LLLDRPPNGGREDDHREVPCARDENEASVQVGGGLAACLH
jgi:hypothetical protein